MINLEPMHNYMMRNLTTSEVESLVKKYPKAQKEDVERFLTVLYDLNYNCAVENANFNHHYYNWNDDTINAVTEGIKMAVKGVYENFLSQDTINVSKKLLGVMEKTEPIAMGNDKGTITTFDNQLPIKIRTIKFEKLFPNFGKLTDVKKWRVKFQEGYLTIRGMDNANNTTRIGDDFFIASDFTYSIKDADKKIPKLEDKLQEWLDKIYDFMIQYVDMNQANAIVKYIETSIKDGLK